MFIMWRPGDLVAGSLGPAPRPLLNVLSASLRFPADVPPASEILQVDAHLEGGGLPDQVKVGCHGCAPWRRLSGLSRALCACLRGLFPCFSELPVVP